MKIIGQADICGDSHNVFGPINYWISHSNIPNLIHVGDSILFEKTAIELGHKLNKAGKNMYVIRGNHCPPIYDGRVYGGQYGGVHLLKNGTVADWNNEKILFNGGGLSLDRSSINTIPNVTYWEDEVFKFVKCDEKIDHLVTHISLTQITGKFLTDPFVIGWCGNDADLMTDLMDEQDEVQFWLNYLIDKQGNKIKTWHYGHYHESILSEYRGIQCRCLAINEIRPFCRKEY